MNLCIPNKIKIRKKNNKYTMAQEIYFLRCCDDIFQDFTTNLSTRVSGSQIFKKQVSISEATDKNGVTVSDCLCYFGLLWLNNSTDRVSFFGVRSMIRDRYLITWR